jgi:hypothetical protein
MEEPACPLCGTRLSRGGSCPACAARPAEPEARPPALTAHARPLTALGADARLSPSYPRALYRACLEPHHLLLLGLGVIGGFTTGGWVFAAAAAIFAGAAHLEARSPRYRREAVALPSAWERWSAGRRILRGPGGRCRRRRLLMARRGMLKITEALADAPPETRSALGSLPARAAEVVRLLRDLAGTAAHLEEYLARVDEAQLLRDEAELLLLGRYATDPQARAHYERAHAALAEQRAAHAQIAAALERIDAQSAHVAFSLHSLHARLVTLHAGAGLLPHLALDRMEAEVAALARDLEAFTDALGEVLHVGRPPLA